MESGTPPPQPPQPPQQPPPGQPPAQPPPGEPPQQPPAQPPPGQPPQQPPPPPPPSQPAPPPGPPKASGGLRAFAVLLALVLAFGAAVMIAAMVDINNTPRCNDPAAIAAYHRSHPLDRSIDCFDGGQTKKVIVMVLGFGGGGVGAIAAVLALAFTVTGRNGRRLLWATALAIILSGLAILIGSV
jgi:heme A synthase